MMGIDRDGYGYAPEERGTARLLDDLRTLSPGGIERVAWGWESHASGEAHARFHQAERAALHALEQAERMEEWDRLRQTVLDLTEGRSSLISWKVEHGDVGHRAENAALAGALALLAAPAVPREIVRVLARPMAEALPWLLPDVAPEPRS